MNRPRNPLEADIVAEANQFPTLVAALRLSLKTLANPGATPDEVASTCAHARGVLLKADALHKRIAPNEKPFATGAVASTGVTAN